MITRQRIEAWSGLLSLIFGILGLGYATFGPIYQYASGTIGPGGQSNSTSGNNDASLWQVGIHPITLIIFCILLLAMFGVAIAALSYSRTQGRGWHIILWLSTIVITIITLLAIFSVGMFFLPALLLALIASIISSVGGRVAAE
ncbi:MAG TPA: hypothetical protein VFB12_02660 [Ktedonobacteraceae bacterium]|nr:hypothetical protein [Ktedonobacteraceae bacterium]